MLMLTIYQFCISSFNVKLSDKNICLIGKISAVPDRDPGGDAADLGVPGGGAHRGQPPDRVPLLHHLHASR